MKKTLMIVLCLAASACKKDDPGINLGEDLSPGAGPFRRDATLLVAILSQTEEKSRFEKLKKDAPHLGESLAYFLSESDRIPRNVRVERVDLYWGSMQDVMGKQEPRSEFVRGYFNDQLIARAYLWNTREPVVDVLVGNFVTVVLPDNKIGGLQRLGTLYPQEAFIVKQGEGLIRSHVDPRLAIALVERFGLRLYRGQKPDPNMLISPAEALRLLDKSSEVQVTVDVKPGAVFDLVNKKYTPALPTEPPKVVKKYVKPKKKQVCRDRYGRQVCR